MVHWDSIGCRSNASLRCCLFCFRRASVVAPITISPVASITGGSSSRCVNLLLLFPSLHIIAGGPLSSPLLALISISDSVDLPCPSSSSGRGSARPTMMPLGFSFSIFSVWWEVPPGAPPCSGTWPVIILFGSCSRLFCRMVSLILKL
jgi:hypothetical protein